MGALIHYTRDPFKPGVYEVRQCVAGIPAHDAVRATFPELADAPLIMQRNGRALYAEDVLEDGDIVWLAARPEWFAAPAAAGFWTQLGYAVLNAFIYAAVSYLIQGLLKPKGKKDKSASPAYSVAIDQNAARLAGTIPVQYGRCLAMPDIASQPYAEFLNHNERVSMILCLGMGEYHINDIYLGESRVLDFPPGNVTTWIFGPNDHASTLGNIERITGVYEDMLTIPETMGVDIAAPNDPPEVTVAGSVSGGSLLPTNPQQAQLWVGLVPGKRYTVANSVGGSVVVTYVGTGPNNSAVFDGPLPAPPAATWIDTPLQLFPFDDSMEGRVMYLYTQRDISALAVDEMVYVDDYPFTTRLGPFQVARLEGRYRAFLRLQGPGFTSATGEQGFGTMRNGAVVRNAFVTYTVTEYVPGVDPAEPYRWRGWYASCRPHNTVDAVFVDITMPNGIAWITDGGDYKSITATFAVDIQQIDDDGNAIGGVIRKTINISGATSTARRLTYKYDLAAARYRIRVARTNNRDQRASKEISAATLASIRCRVYHPPGTRAYEQCTLMVMQFNASAGLNAASNRRVTVDCTRKLPHVNDPSLLWTGSNPAHAAADAYQNTVYGGARPRSEFDVAKYTALHYQWDATNGFNGIFDSETTLIEAMQSILSPVKALPLPVGKTMSVVQDAPRVRSYAFGDDTIVKDTMTLGYLFDGENQPDCICVLYRDPKTFVEARAFYPSEGVRPEVMDLFGCTDYNHAVAWAKLTWQQKQLQRKRVTFQLEGEGYLLDPLDHFGLTLAATVHGQAGRCIQYDDNGDGTGLMLCDCVLPDDVAYCQLIAHDGGLTATFAAQRVSDQVVKIWNPPWLPHGASPSEDATNFVLLKDVTQFYEFSVTDLKTGGDLKVEVTAQQYNAAAYTGTFVENWITGD